MVVKKCNKCGCFIGRNKHNCKDAWNKGLTKETDERVAKYGKSSSKTKKRLFKEGKLKSWNVGLTKETDPRVMKISKNNSMKRPEVIKKHLKAVRIANKKPERCRKISDAHRNMDILLRLERHILQSGNNPMKRPKIAIKSTKEYNPIRAKKISKALKGKPKSERHKKNIGKSEKGKIVSEKSKKKMRETWRRKYENGYICRNLGRKRIDMMGQNAIVRRPGVMESILKSLLKRPTSYEKMIIDLCSKHNLPYNYVGNGQVIINYGNPDFINNNGQKKLIEVYCNYFKNRGFGSCEKYEQQRAKRFAKFGFKTLFLRTEDFKKGEQHLLKRIKEFDKL